MSASKVKAKQTSLFSFFSKKPNQEKDEVVHDVLSPKRKNNNLDDDSCKTPGSTGKKRANTPKNVPATPSPGLSKSQLEEKFKTYDLVWAKLDGYPWWPGLVVPHHKENTHVKLQKKTALIHTQFFDNPTSRAWVKSKYVEPYTGSDSVEFERGGRYYSSDPDCFQGTQQADEAMKMTREKRKDLVVQLLSTSESEDEDFPEKMDFNADIFDTEIDEGEQNTSNNSSKENQEDGKQTPGKSPQKKVRKAAKRRKIIVEDNGPDDSEDEFKPDGDSSSEDEGSSGVDEEDVSEPESGSEAGSPVKGVKRKRGSVKKAKNSPSQEGVVRRGKVPNKTKSALSSFSNKKRQQHSDEEDDMDASEVKTPNRASKESVCKTPSRDSSDNSSTPSRPSTFTPSVSNKTKSKLASFTAETVSKPPDAPADVKMPHLSLDFLKPEKIRDANKKRPDDSDYNPRTLHVPENYLNALTPGVRQWWVLKSEHYDCVIFFKVGKFYELYHMDAVTGVNELGLIYMKGEFAHCGFPEIAFRRYADTLIQKGYRVARVEQTETPDMVTERCKKMFKTTKFDKVVKREICRIQTRGTKVYSFIDGDVAEAKNAYLLAVCEREEGESLNSTYGVAFVDTSIGKFHLGQFEDDRHGSRLRTLMSHYQPAEILFERGKVSTKTQQIFKNGVLTSLKTPLRPGAEFWDSTKTLKCLAEESYFINETEKDGGLQWPAVLKSMISELDPLCQTAADEKDLAIRSLGALIWYLKDCCSDHELLSLKSFEEYQPLDRQTEQLRHQQSDAVGLFLPGQKMVLDGVTVANLELVENSSGTVEGTLLEHLDYCNTPFGKRLFRQWLCAPLCHPESINDRQDAVEDLMAIQDVVAETQEKMKKLPDLERVLSKFHTLGSTARSKNHPDSRAIFFEDVTYSKRKIEDLLCALEGFALAVKIIKGFEKVANGFKSKLLQSCVKLQDDGGKFPDLSEQLKFFDNAFDHAKAKQEGVIKPRKGVDEEYDQAVQDIINTKSEMDDYIAEQKKALGCRSINLFGSGKNRFQLEIADSVRVPDDYEVVSSKKGYRRYWTEEIKDFLSRTSDAEDRRDSALKDIMRRIFFAFDKHYWQWEAAVQCMSVLDVLLSLSQFSRCGEGAMCRPTIINPEASTLPFLEIREGRHPCISKTFSGGEFIPNDTVVGIKDENDIEDEGNEQSKVVLITGPNMGGKSTLMRQVGVIVVIAQLGCYVPAEKCMLTPVDRVFTRLGATDRIMAGESTFFVELSETSAILQHATPNSLVLLDELGRGTATYDGTAIACAVVQHLSQKVNCRTLFSTHYHSLVEEFSHDPNIRLGHMACMVENENEEDPSQETITFLYKFVKGACPKSYGFNAARLANLPEDIIRAAQEKARDFENTNSKLHIFRQLTREQEMSSESLLPLQALIPVS